MTLSQTLKTSSYWSGDDGQCMNPGCAVDTCDDQELPDFLRGKTSTFVLQSTTQRGSSLSGLGPAVHSVPSPAFNLSLPFIESNIKTKMCIWFLKKCVNKEIVLTKWFYRKHLYSCLLNISVRRLIVHLLSESLVISRLRTYFSRILSRGLAMNGSNGSAAEVIANAKNGQK